MNIWVKMNRPLLVAPLVATKELQWSPFPPTSNSSSPVMKVRPLRALAVWGNADTT